MTTALGFKIPQPSTHIGMKWNLFRRLGEICDGPGNHQPRVVSTRFMAKGKDRVGQRLNVEQEAQADEVSNDV